jgi:mRNA deadenylase 3'-5' endonuclease subunit Ccr4
VVWCHAPHPILIVKLKNHANAAILAKKKRGDQVFMVHVLTLYHQRISYRNVKIISIRTIKQTSNLITKYSEHLRIQFNFPVHLLFLSNKNKSNRIYLRLTKILTKYILLMNRIITKVISSLLTNVTFNTKNRITIYSIFCLNLLQTMINLFKI